MVGPYRREMMVGTTVKPKPIMVITEAEERVC